MYLCPTCRKDLGRVRSTQGVFWKCTHCGGRAASTAFLRKIMTASHLKELWAHASAYSSSSGRPCPVCERPSEEVKAGSHESPLYLDVCKRCAFIWFDPGEYEALPPLPRKEPEQDLSAEARKVLALDRVKQLGDRASAASEGPETWWQALLIGVGFPIEEDAGVLARSPIITWLLAGGCVLLYLLSLPPLRIAIEDLAFIPAAPLRLGGLTVLASFFLHGGFLHLFGNLYFLLVFGDNVEDALGQGRYVLLVLFAHLAGCALHMSLDPRSLEPVVGSSAGISGILAFYALRFPDARITILLGSYWMGLMRWLRIKAWILFLLWILLQILGAAQELRGFGEVSYLGHLGGVSVGVLAWALHRRESAGK